MAAIVFEKILTFALIGREQLLGGITKSHPDIDQLCGIKVIYPIICADQIVLEDSR